MKVKCLHGYFLFEETKIGQVSDFMAYTGFSIVPVQKHFTFEALQEAPVYSLLNKPVLGVPAIKTFQGEPWEVFEANGLVFDFTTNRVRKIEDINLTTQIKAAGNRWVSPGLILPGSINQDGDVVRDFSGFFSRDTLKWVYTEVSYV